MKISPLYFNLNNQVKNNRVQRLAPMACDSVSFSAKIPANLNAELKYKSLQEQDNTGYLKIKVSEDPEIVKLLQELKEDTAVSPEFKTKILLQDPNGKEYNPLVSRISKCGKDDVINYEVAKALIEASPDIETTKRQLLTPIDSIPLFHADAKGAKLLLSASPDRETLRAQVLAKDSSGRKAIWGRSQTKRDTIWSFCDKELKKELLTQPEDIFNAYYNDGLKVRLNRAEDEETKLQMLQATNEHGYNLFHIVRGEEFLKYLAEQLKDHPEVLKKLLLQRGSDGKLPMDRSWGNYDRAAALFELSPDDETRKAQLLAKPGDYDDSLVVLCKCRNLDPMYYLKASPDDETLIKQLNSGKHGDRYDIIRGQLDYSECTEVLQTFKNVENKKEFLLGTWKEYEHTSARYPKKVTLSQAQVIEKSYNERFAHRFDEVEKFSNALIEIIGDDSTTEEEAIKLIELYKGCTSKVTQNYLTQLEEYFKSQVEE